MEAHFSRYRALVTDLARQCLDRAADAPVLVQARGASVAIGASAARVLLGEMIDPASHQRTASTLADAARADQPRFNDTFGFSRPTYHPLLVHLYLRSLHVAGQSDVSPTANASGMVPADLLRPPLDTEPALTRPRNVALTLWWALCRYDSGQPADIDAARAAVQTIVDAPGPDGSLHPRQEEDQLDAWTYRELAGLHALARLALADHNPAWQQRVREVALHHQAVTQPDYTTYQPWAVFAFLSIPETTLFGEQQLHDTATNLHVESPGAGLIAGLILADAADAMAGTPPA